MNSQPPLLQLPSPYDDPTITIYFTGLVAIYYAKPIVFAGIHNNATDHKLTAELISQNPGQPPSAPKELNIDIQKSGFMLDVTLPDPATLTSPTFPFYSGTDFADFGYLIKLDGPDFHNGQLNVIQPDYIKYGVRINQGAILYNADPYWASITDPTGSKHCKMISFTVGIDIKLLPAGTAILTYTDSSGTPQKETFSAANKYILRLSNVHTSGAGTGHFEHWYDIFRDKKETATKKIRFDAEKADQSCIAKFIAKRKATNRDTHDNPCNPIYLGETPVSTDNR